MSKRYFINNIDTRFGQALFKQLVKEPPEDPIHMCTVRDPKFEKPKGIKKILKRQKPKLSKKKMLEQSDVYIYSIDETDFEDINFGISIFDKNIQQQKVFILVSDIMSWSGSGRKVKVQKKPEGQEGKDEVKEQQPIKQPESNQEGSVHTQKSQDQHQVQKQVIPQIQQKPVQYTFWEDKDYQKRVPLYGHEYIKYIQQKVLNLKKQNVKVYVICPGILYGQGEHHFYQLFKTAWLQNIKQSHYLGAGNNLIPTIHIADLAKFVIKISQSPPQDSPYLLAFDDAKDRSQKAIIQSISQGAGSGKLRSVNESWMLPFKDRFLLNIDIRPSKLLVGSPDEPVQFQWTCRYGLQESVKKVLEEFCQHHLLRPLNILTMIPDNERHLKDSKYAQILKSLEHQYRTPVLRIEQILLYAKQHAPQELKNDLAQENLNILNYISQKKARPLDETLKVLYRVMKWRLSRNDCACRGYILDNYPLFQQEAKHIFLPLSSNKLKRKIKKVPKKVAKVQITSEMSIEQGKQPQVPPEEEQQIEQDKQQEINEEQGEKPKAEKFYPESIIKIKKVSEKQSYFNQVANYLSMNGTEVLIYDTTKKQNLQIFESLRSYIQRNGRPNNYLISQQELLKQHKAYYHQVNKSKQEQKKKSDEQTVKEKEQIKKKREKLAQEVYESVKFEGEFEIKKMPFRNYLMEFVVPILNQGLLQVSNIIPNDPVELLAEYLYQKSYEV